MSYILDALRKSERERDLAQVPTLATVHDVAAAPPSRRWIVSGVFLLCVVAALWFLLPALKKSARTPPPAGDLNREPVGSELRQVAASSSSPAKQSPAFPQPGPSHEAAAHTTRPTVEANGASGTVARPIGQQPTVLSAVQPASPQSSSGADGGRPEEGKPAAAAVQAKPLPLREAMAKMNMSILLFSDIKAERLVFINGRKYLEGDYIEGNYLLESITPEGAVLSYGGERAILRSGSK